MKVAADVETCSHEVIYYKKCGLVGTNNECNRIKHSLHATVQDKNVDLLQFNVFLHI